MNKTLQQTNKFIIVNAKTGVNGPFGQLAEYAAKQHNLKGKTAADATFKRGSAAFFYNEKL